MRSRLEQNERGAALVEMAMVLPFLFLMVFGMIETGMAWRNSITVTSATRQGARVASHLGPELQSDREGLYALEAVLGDLMDDVELVVFFRADGSGDVPTACLGGSQSTGSVRCNTYDVGMIAQLSDDTKWGCTGTAFDRTWCPDTRDNDPADADHLGVFIRYDHGYFTGIFPGDGITIERHTVMRIEPELE